MPAPRRGPRPRAWLWLPLLVFLPPPGGSTPHRHALPWWRPDGSASSGARALHHCRGGATPERRESLRSKKTPLRTLKQLLQELEESDYGAHAWGQQGLASRHQPSPMTPMEGEFEDYSAGRWSDPTIAEADVAAAAAAAVAELPKARSGGRGRKNRQAKRREQAPHNHQPADPYGWQQPQSAVARHGSSVEDLRAAAAPTPTGNQDSPFAMVAPGVEEDEELTNFDVNVSEALKTLYRVSAVLVLGMVLGYTSVSPRTAPRGLYNKKYKQNCALQLAAAAPSMLFSSVLFDGDKMSVNNMVKVVYQAFSLGYLTCFVAQMVQATLYRLAVYSWLEPQIFDGLCPEVPLTALPWTFRDYGYRLRPLSVFVSEFAVDCLGAPLVEEAVKLWIVLRSGVLPPPTKGKYTSVHTYLGYMVAASMGLKLADNLRRVCLYTGHSDHQKTFFAFARGVFPLHEICGALTAMQLAKREILGRPLPYWRIILPATVLHAMGNFRGKKPLFKWASGTPWVEMQLQAWSTADDAPPSKVIMNGCLGLFWLSILVRVLVDICRRYYDIAKHQRRALRIERYQEWQQKSAPGEAPEAEQQSHGRGGAGTARGDARRPGRRLGWGFGQGQGEYDDGGGGSAPSQQQQQSQGF